MVFLHQLGTWLSQRRILSCDCRHLLSAQPIGGISLAVIIFFLKAEYTALNRSDDSEYSVWQRWLRLDWIGTILCLGMVTSLLLPLQWGGNTKSWKDHVVIALFCVFGVLLISFIIWEWKMGRSAILPLHMFRRRTQVGCCLVSVSLLFSSSTTQKGLVDGTWQFFVMMMLLVGAS